MRPRADIAGRTQGRRAFYLTVCAFLWCIALVAAALVLPAYSGSGVDSAGHQFSSTATLVQENGAWVLVVISVPGLITALVWVALHRRCSRGGRASGYGAWALICGLFAGCLLTGFSVGILMLPVAGLLAVATSLTPEHRAQPHE